MVDPALLVKMYLLQDAALVAMLGRYTVRRGDLPPKFNPVLGACITTSMHTGKAHSEVLPIRADWVRVRVWAGVNQYAQAWNIYGEVNRWLHGQNNVDLSPYGFMLSSQEQSAQEVTDPGPGDSLGWSTVNSFYLIQSRESQTSVADEFITVDGGTF